MLSQKKAKAQITPYCYDIKVNNKTRITISKGGKERKKLCVWAVKA